MFADTLRKESMVYFMVSLMFWLLLVYLCLCYTELYSNTVTVTIKVKIVFICNSIEVYHGSAAETLRQKSRSV